ncbi:MAG: hypothetical protein WD851_14840 [Pirellulales bacterium]
MRLLTFGTIIVAAFACLPAWSQTSSGGTQGGGQNPQAAGTGQAAEPAQVGGQARAGAQVDVPGQVGAGSGDIGERPWFGNPGVREQLGIDENRFNQLNQGYGTAWSRYNQSLRGLGNNLADRQRNERMRALRGDFDRNFSQSRDAVFTDPRVRTRYNQLHYQYQGYRAFDDPTLQQRLGLTTEQRQRLGQYRDEWNGQMSDLEEGYANDPDTASTRYRDLQMQSRERLGTVLTPQQRRQWNETIGDNYDFPPDSYFGGERTARNPEGAIPNPTLRQ